MLVLKSIQLHLPVGEHNKVNPLQAGYAHLSLDLIIMFVVCLQLKFSIRSQGAIKVAVFLGNFRWQYMPVK